MHSIQSYCEVVVVVVSAAAVRPRSSTIRHFIDILHAFHLEMRVRFAMNAIFHSPLIIALQRELRVAPLLGVNRWYARCDRVALIVKCYIHWRRRFSSPRHVLWTNAMLWFSSSSLVSSGIQQWTKHSHCWERIQGRTEEATGGYWDRHGGLLIHSLQHERHEAPPRFLILFFVFRSLSSLHDAAVLSKSFNVVWHCNDVLV
jgi:hypothetical protein